jgi:aminobenzoyl-glutamate transport protein
MAPGNAAGAAGPAQGWIVRALGLLERAGNRLPDPAFLFVLLLPVVWVLSKLLAPVAFDLVDPRTDLPLRVNDLLTGRELTRFLVEMVTEFTGFAPLGIVLVAMLGVGVAEHAGCLRTALKLMLRLTPAALLTPMLVFVGNLSNIASDVGFVVVIPFGGLLFAAAGRHPLAGIAAAFAGVSGGFSANVLPSGLDPLLQSITQQAVAIVAPGRLVHPLCNWLFMAVSSVLLVLVGWYLTERVIEPRLAGTRVDPDADLPRTPEPITPAERRGVVAALAVLLGLLALLAWAAWSEGSPLRDERGLLASSSAPLMRAIVPLIFLLSLAPGIAYGVAAGTIQSHRDVIAGMSRAMSTMAYYLVVAFCAAQFIAAFTDSNLGVLLSLAGADALQRLGLAPQLTVLGAILLATGVNLLIGSSSAKWLLLAPVLVPMLATLGVAPELTQAAYRIGDSSTNIITPLMPYFPLVVEYCRRYVKATGIGTLSALMLPFSLAHLATWSALLLLFWQLGIPLGLESHYTFP